MSKHLACGYRGFSLIEVLITLLILAIGLLGLAGLQSKMLGTEFEAYQRSQALTLARDMANRIQLNPADGRADAYSGNSVYGTGDSLNENCSPTAPVDSDLCAWSRALKGVAVVSSDGVKLGSLIGAKGCIEKLSGAATSHVVMRVTVAWQGLTPSAAPSVSCGRGSYGTDDALRRTVSIIVTLGYLGV